MPDAGRFADLRARVLTALVLGSVAFGAIWAGGLWAVALVTLGTGLMLVEAAAITTAKAGQMELSGVTSWALPAITLPAAFLFLNLPEAIALGLFLVVAMLGIDLLSQRSRGMGPRTITAIYILMAGLAFLWIRHFPEWGLRTAIWVAIVVAAADIGGYFAGRLIGGAKLWPSVSKGKTWAGLFGGIGLAFLVGGLFSWATTGTYFYQVCTVSALAALLSQGGDLAESALKRHYGVKDASGILPGHGGILDRCDGLMAASLVAAVVTYWRGQAVFVW